jgi:hypothetical protein
MIQTQSQNEEIRQIRDKVAGEVCDEAGNWFRWKVTDEVWWEVWWKVGWKVGWKLFELYKHNLKMEN